VSVDEWCRPELARALTALGQVERDRHRGEAALHCYEEAVGLYRVEGDALGWRTQCDTWETFIGSRTSRFGWGLLSRSPGYLSESRGNSALDLANAIRGLAILRAIRRRRGGRALWRKRGSLRSRQCEGWRRGKQSAAGAAGASH